MAQRRVTIQSIADACGLSRATVSKVFNNGSVPNSTRELVLKKADEMGYFNQISSVPLSSAVPQSIAILSCSNPMNHHFGSMFIKAFTDAVCREGYTVQMYELSDEELSEHRLPARLVLENTVGILGIELFDQSFIRFICGLNVPVILVDGYCGIAGSGLPCDVISMENFHSTAAVTRQIIEKGAKTFGFVGDIMHCSSFHERWDGFCKALQDAGIAPDREYCILAPDGRQYADLNWTVSQLKKMPLIPDAFVCANDYHAVKLLLALKNMGLSVPKDVMVAGFGDDPEASLMDPGLTTVFIPSSEMGTIAAAILFFRLDHSGGSRSVTYLQTDPVFRGSTYL